jgi:hypothetical protein
MVNHTDWLQARTSRHYQVVLRSDAGMKLEDRLSSCWLPRFSVLCSMFFPPRWLVSFSLVHNLLSMYIRQTCINDTQNMCRHFSTGFSMHMKDQQANHKDWIHASATCECSSPTRIINRDGWKQEMNQRYLFFDTRSATRSKDQGKRTNTRFSHIWTKLLIQEPSQMPGDRVQKTSKLLNQYSNSSQKRIHYFITHMQFPSESTENLGRPPSWSSFGASFSCTFSLVA